MPRVIDLSQQLSSRSLSYPGTSVVYEVDDIDIGDPDARVSRFSSFDIHGGTHMDAPLHFDPSGASIDAMELRLWPLRLVQVGTPWVETASVPADCKGAAILFYTGWQEKAGTPAYYVGFPHISAAAAALLVERGVGLVGIDSPSVDGIEANPTYSTHKLLCGAGIPIVEGLVNLDLLVALDEDVRFAAFPLALEALEASPVRAVALLRHDEQ